MNVSDKLVNIIHQVDLMRLEAGERQAILRLLLNLRRDIEKDLLRYKGVVNITSPINKKRMEFKLKKTKQLIDKTYKQIARRQGDFLYEMAEYEWKYSQDALYNALNISVNATIPSENMLRSIAKQTLVLGGPAQERWGQRANWFYDKVKDQIRAGLMLGETPAQLAKRIRMGVTPKERRGATALARTAFQAITQQARMKSYQDLKGVIKGYQWLSTLDSRTSLICASLSGSAWDLDYKPLPGTSKRFPGPPPAHWNCRSQIIPIVKSYEDLLGTEIGSKLKKLPPATQASIDGQVAEDISYLDWLKSQDAETQTRVLGKGRRKLWKEGKIKAKDLIDQSFRPLTLKQLKNK